MLWGCVDFALMAESRRVVEHVRLHPVGGCSAQRLTNQPTFALLAGSRKVVVFSGCTRWVAVVANVLPTNQVTSLFLIFTQVEGRLQQKDKM